MRVTVGDSTYVVVFVWRLSSASANWLPWLLILHRYSRPHPTSLLCSQTDEASYNYGTDWLLNHTETSCFSQSPVMTVAGPDRKLTSTIELNAIWCASGAGPPNSLERDVTTEWKRVFSMTQNKQCYEHFFFFFFFHTGPGSHSGAFWQGGLANGVAFAKQEAVC